MTRRHLEIFIEVVDTNNMTKAAENLYISQPTVSQAIKEIEEFFGIKLFDRIGKKLYLTDQGEHLLSYARHIFDLYQEMEQAIKNPDQGGVLRIGASQTVGEAYLPKRIRQFKQDRPSVHLQCVIKNTADIEELLLENSIDFGIVEGRVHHRDIISNKISQDRLILVCGKSHPFYKKREMPMTALQNQDFLVREKGSGTRESFEWWMDEKGIDWNTIMECQGFGGIIEGAKAGLGLAIISPRLIQEELLNKSLRQLCVNQFEIKRHFYLIYHKNKYRTPNMELFFQSLGSHAKIGHV